MSCFLVFIRVPIKIGVLAQESMRWVMRADDYDLNITKPDISLK